MMINKIIFKSGKIKPRKFVKNFSVGQDLADFGMIKRIRVG